MEAIPKEIIRSSFYPHFGLQEVARMGLVNKSFYWISKVILGNYKTDWLSTPVRRLASSLVWGTQSKWIAIAALGKAYVRKFRSNFLKDVR